MKALVRDAASECTVEVKVGDCVGFKSDTEQSGRIVEIKPAAWGHVELTLESGRERGFSGEYIGGQRYTKERASDCWAL